MSGDDSIVNSDSGILLMLLLVENEHLVNFKINRLQYFTLLKWSDLITEHFHNLSNYCSTFKSFVDNSRRCKSANTNDMFEDSRK